MAELSEIEWIIGEAKQATSAGDDATAERALRRALRLQEAGLGLAHPDVANTLNDLGFVCDRLGRPDEAEFLYRRALGIARRTREPDHPNIATSLQNLANFYRAQGRPEKLGKASEGRSPESGLPEVNAAEGSWDEAETTEEMARPTTPAVAVPVTHSQGDTSQQSQSQTVSVWFAQPVVLVVGTAIALLLVVWLLFVGNAQPELGDQDGAGTGTSLQASGGERGTVGVGPAGSPASSGSEAMPNAEDAAVTSLVAPASADGIASVPEPSSDRLPATVADEGGDASPEPAARRPDTRATPVVAASSVVVAAEICTQLDTRGADGATLAEWQCDPVVDRAAPEPLFFYTRIRSRTNTTVGHQWFRDGVLEDEIDLDIGANDGRGYRTYSSHTVSPQERGAWRVELRSSDQDLLHVEEFVVP